MQFYEKFFANSIIIIHRTGRQLDPAGSGKAVKQLHEITAKGEQEHDEYR